MCTYQRMYSHICLRVFKHADELIHIMNCLFYESTNTAEKGDYFQYCSKMAQWMEE